jgi:hypothetical protein
MRKREMTDREIAMHERINKRGGYRQPEPGDCLVFVAWIDNLAEMSAAELLVQGWLPIPTHRGTDTVS